MTNKVIDINLKMKKIKMIKRCKSRIGKNIQRIKRGKMHMVFDDCYNTILDSASIPIILFGMEQPKPEDMTMVLYKIMRKLELKGISIEEIDLVPLDLILTFRKMVLNKTLTEMSGDNLDVWLLRTEKFIEDMESLSRKIEKTRVDGPFLV